MTGFKSLIVPSWLGFKPYQPGKSIESLAAEAGIKPEDICKLASNENPLPASDVIRSAYFESIEQLARYPDGGGEPLKSVLSDYFGVEPSSIVLGAGSNGILDGLARIFLEPGQSAMFSQYAFMLYQLAVQARGAEPIVVPAKDWGHDLEAFSDIYATLLAKGQPPRLVFLANPNNPTGTWFSKQSLQSFLSQVDAEKTIVVLDEAYAEYCRMPDYPDSLSLLKEHSNLVVTRTFSKAWGLAGLRVGYAIASPEICQWLNVERAPFNVAGPGLHVAAAALADDAYLERVVEHNSTHLALMQRWLETQNINFIPSVANFVTLVLEGVSAKEVFQKLLLKGVITRPLCGYLMPQCLRVSVGSSSENTTFYDAFLWAMGQSGTS